MTHLLAILAIALYTASAVMLFVQLWRSQEGRMVWRTSRVLFGVAFLFHTATMVYVLQDPNLVLLDNGADYFLWVSWALGLAFAFLQRRVQYPIIGAFVIPAIVVFMGSSSYLLHKESVSVLSSSNVPAQQDLFLSLLHAVPALVSVVSMALALVVSVVFFDC